MVPAWIRTCGDTVESAGITTVYVFAPDEKRTLGSFGKPDAGSKLRLKVAVSGTG